MIRFILFISTLLLSWHSYGQLEAEVLNHIEETLAPFSSADQPGLSAAIIKDGEIVYMASHGTKNMTSGEVADIHSLYQVDAIARQFTTLAFLQLIEQGKAQLTDDVRKHLPQLKKYNHTITLDHVLNHTTGLDDYKIVRQLYGVHSFGRTHNDEALSIIAAQEELAYKPGSEFSIFDGDTESLLMAAIIESATEMSFPEFVDEYVFSYLGLDDAIFIDDHTHLYPNKVEAYRQEDGQYYSISDANEIVGPGNLFISIHDIAKWYQYFSPSCTERGHELVKQLGKVCLDADGNSYQSGWGEMTIGRSYFHFESGAPMYWQYGLRSGFGANLFRFPGEDITTIVLGNNNQYNGSFAMNMVHPLVEHAFTRGRQISSNDIKVFDLVDELIEPWAGTYHDFNFGQSRTMSFENDTLRYVRRGQAISLLPIGPSEFQALVASDDILKFKFGGKGQNRFYDITSGDSAPIRYNVIDHNYTPAAILIDEYVGTYVNESIGQIFQFEEHEGGLRLSHHLLGDHELRAIKQDVFASDVYVLSGVEFIRSEQQVVGVRFKAPGMQAMTLKKALLKSDKSL